MEVKAELMDSAAVARAITRISHEIIERNCGAENVALTMGLVGVHAPNYPVNLIHLWNAGPEEGWLAVQLKSGSGVRVEELKERLRGVFAREFPEIRADGGNR